MMNCTKCRCGGRVERIDEREDGQYALYVCPNPRCANYKQVFGEEWIGPKAEFGFVSETNETNSPAAP